jgi:hypothetical protein
MTADHFVKVFDVLDSGFRDWTFPAFGLIFVIVGIAIFAFPKIIKATGVPYLNFHSRWQAFFRYAFLGFGIFWTAATFLGTYSQHLRHKALVENNQCRIVEGPIEHFVPMPYSGHALESFSVAGVPFRYSDFIVTDGFNNTSSRGGPINSNSYVRICYDPSDNAILRLEIRDFVGNLKDYTRAWSLFEMLADAQDLHDQNPPIKVRWYANLPVVLVILDLIAIQTMFLPYLRIFFRLKTAMVRDCSVPSNLESRKTIKLRNSVIYWEKETQTIWLRPRGLNLFQAPLMAAALKTDPEGRSITGDELRFSSGFPFTVALLLWGAFESFPATASANISFPPALLFIGLAALVFLIGGFVSRSRMEILVQDALSELKDMSGPWDRATQPV